MPRKRLSRDRIVGAAIALADGHGVAAVTMRKLAQQLGFEAMSLYRHVAHKDDLLDGMLRQVLEEMTPPVGDGPWHDAVRSSALSVRAALGRHPWATALLMHPPHVQPARLSYMDALLQRLREAGFSADATYHAYHVLDSHIFGFALWEAAYTTGLPADLERTLQEIPFDDYPFLAEHRDQHLADGPLHEVSAFELGLDLILEGLEKVRSSTTAQNAVS